VPDEPDFIENKKEPELVEGKEAQERFRAAMRAIVKAEPDKEP
jgi:hypothetical protein